MVTAGHQTFPPATDVRPQAVENHVTALAPSELTAAPQLVVVLAADDDDTAQRVREHVGDTFGLSRVRTLSATLAVVGELSGHACVLLDLRLRDAHGLAGVQAIRHAHPHVPIIVLIGAGDEALGLEAVAAGAQDYLVKDRLDGDTMGRAIRYAAERGSSAAELAEVSERFSRTFEEAPLGIALVDCQADAGRVIQANRALGSILGLPHDELLGRSVEDFTHWEDRAAQAEAMRAIASGDADRYSENRRLIQASGRVVSCVINGSAVRDAAGQLLYGIAVVEDVTEHRRQEEELREAHTALDSAVLGIALSSLAGRCRTVNAYYAATLGYEPDELVGMTWDRLIHPDDWGRFRDAIAKALCGERANIEVRGLRKDGSAFAKEVVLIPNTSADGALTGYIHFMRDVSERRRGQQALELSEARYRSFIETANDGICLVGNDGRVDFVNGRLCEMLGRVAGQIVGQPLGHFMHPSEDAGAVERPQELSARNDYRFVRPDGTDVWMLVSTSPQVHDGEFTGALAMLSDITVRKQAEAELARMALTDELTGLPNRAALGDRLRLEIPAVHGESGLALLFIDLDRFKQVNDAYGRLVGDELLQQVTKRLRAVVAEGDVLASFGGDEFVMLCHGIVDDRAVHAAADRVLAALDSPMGLSVGRVCVSASVGIAVTSDARSSAEELLRDGDIAMYRAKDAGGAARVVFDVAMRQAVVDDMLLEQDLRKALADGALSLAYQPIVRLPDESVAGFEALLRWTHPDRGPVSPAEFIPVAERSGLIIDIGRWVLAEACSRIAEWSRAGGAEWGRVAVNVSARQVDQPGFVEDVRRILEDSGVGPDRLVLEITETALFSKDPAATEATLEALGDLGLDVLLDDFGTGYSSLSYLSRFRLDGLKLDRSFIRDVETDPGRRSIVEAVTAMAQSLGLRQVGEGVETVAQASLLASLGCDLAQGYLFARPMPHEDVPTWIGSRVRHLPAGQAQAGAEPGSAWMSIGDAAQALGVSASTLRRWSDEGRVRTRRTSGGHRRFSVPDLKRLAHGVMQPRVRRSAPPTHPLPEVATRIEADGARIVAVVADRLYERSALGWYATDRSRRPVRQWLDAVARAFRRGAFDDLDEATAGLVRHAEIGGASFLESTLFVERFLASLVKVLQRSGEASPIDPGVLSRALTAVRHGVAKAH